MNPPITINLTSLNTNKRKWNHLGLRKKKLEIKHMDFYKKLVSSLILFPPLNSFPPFRSKEKLVSAETIQGNTVDDYIAQSIYMFGTEINVFKIKINKIISCQN